MKALLCVSPGPADSLVFSQIERPQPGPGEVQIKVSAIALNFLDTLIIQGRYQVKPEFPFSPGAELSGRITALGKGADREKEAARLAVGDRVMAFPGTGALAEWALAKSDQVVALPDGIDDATAAALPVAYGTCVHALKDRAALAAGETVLVLGAAGGVGMAAVGCARAMGATVIAAASTDAKLELARAHGASGAINTTTCNLRARLRELTPGGSVDVVIDPVGGALTEPAYRSTAWGGRHLVVGFASGDIPRLPLNLPLVKGSAVIGVYWGRFAALNPAANRDNLARVMRWIDAGKVKPHLGAIYDFDQARQAIADLAGRRAMGKIIVRME